jgi:hypothetical protein
VGNYAAGVLQNREQESGLRQILKRFSEEHRELLEAVKIQRSEKP